VTEGTPADTTEEGANEEPGVLAPDEDGNFAAGDAESLEDGEGSDNEGAGEMDTGNERMQEQNELSSVEMQAHHAEEETHGMEGDEEHIVEEGTAGGQEDVEELLSAGEEMAVEGEGEIEGDMEGAGMADDLAPDLEAMEDSQTGPGGHGRLSSSLRGR